MTEGQSEIHIVFMNSVLNFEIVIFLVPFVYRLLAGQSLLVNKKSLK